MHDERPIDVTVVLFDGGYFVDAVAPLEVFHAAGLCGRCCAASRSVRAFGCAAHRSTVGR
jgi:putative intracellular protease/amidase